MAAVSEDLRTFTIADATVAAIVSDRMHELHVPQSELKPHVYYGRINTEDERTLDSAVGEEPFRNLFTVECWGLTPEDADVLAGAIRDRLNNYRGTFASRTVQGVFVSSQSDDYEPKSEGSDKGLYLAALAVEVVG
jgi:hypothetical protein